MLPGDIESNPGKIVVNHNDLSICHLNYQSILNKIDLITQELSKFDIITLNETWFDHSIYTKDILKSQIIRNPSVLTGTHGGGVVVYFNQSVPFVERKELHIPHLETIWAEVKY